MNRIRNVILGFLGCLLLSGCSVYQRACQTLWREPSAFSARKDDSRTRERYCQLANEAWFAMLKENPGIACSGEFEQGFKDGFADYLYAGGTGEPPPVPPRCLWNLDYRTPQGHQAVDDWFAGFRRGAAKVREGGYREQATIHSSLCRCNDALPSTAPPGQTEQARPIEVIPTPSPANLPLHSPPVVPPGKVLQASPQEPVPPSTNSASRQPQVAPVPRLSLEVPPATGLPSAVGTATPQSKPKQIDDAPAELKRQREAQDAADNMLRDSEQIRRLNEALRPHPDT